MTPEDAAKLVAIVQTLCPTQKWPENMASAVTAWHMVLGKTDREDALNAVSALAQRHAAQDNPTGRPLYIDPTSVLHEVRRVRARRVELEAHRAPAPAAIGADGQDLSPEAFMAELRRRTNEIAGGQAPQWPRAIAAPPEGPKYVGKPGQWAEGADVVEPHAAVADVRAQLAAVRGRREPEPVRALPAPLEPEVEAAFDAARRFLGTFEDLGEPYLEQARKAAPDATRVEHYIAAAEAAREQTRKAS